MAPVHILVIPKKHIQSMLHVEAEDAGLIGRVMLKAADLAKEHGCGDKGARFVINAGRDGGQTVDHIHIHVLGERRLSWPPG
jgi:histidine triad (HIT) family protein